MENIKTIVDLENYFVVNHPDKDNFIIGNFGKYGFDGFGLDKQGSLYVWFYYEKNDKQNLKYFDSETKAVEFALNEIKKVISKT